MSRLTDLLAQIKKKDSQLGDDLDREFKVLASRRSFGLNFERHRPEAVELPQRPVRKGDKVRLLPERGSTQKGDQRLWAVKSITKSGQDSLATISLLFTDEPETQEVSVDDLVVVAEFQDYIYPGLVSTGKVERGGDKPFHTVINGENYHALKALTYTHRGKVDAIYIDPPYNTGAKDWKYNNDYVEKDDWYRHSKWLAMMERRISLAETLLRPDISVLIVTIDARECHRLGLLLEQTFPQARIQMISSLINPKGVSTVEGFRRADEYIFFVMIGSATPARLPLPVEWSTSPTQANIKLEAGKLEKPQQPGWTSMMRRGSESARANRPLMFYPIYVDPKGKQIVEVGEPIPSDKHTSPERPGLVSILPLRANGEEGRWQISGPELKNRIIQGRVRLGRRTHYGFVVNYLPDGAYAEVLSEKFQIVGRAEDGSLIAESTDVNADRIPPTQWKIQSHNASEHGSSLLRTLIPGRSFPFPKSLYAVEDTLRFFINDNKKATVLDFFAGSGTTAHAVMRLNRLDGGQRQCILVTNNEAGADEQKNLRENGHRPGDEKWEELGICDYITKPRIEAAITGKTADGKKIKGDYKFTDEFPMSEGFKENAEFFTLTYESPISISHNLAFQRIAPLLWMRAGCEGDRIETVPEQGWEVVETYGLLTDLDQAAGFCAAVTESDTVRIAYIVTNDDRRFQAVSRGLPDHVEPVRLYESYITNFRFTSGD